MTVQSRTKNCILCKSIFTESYGCGNQAWLDRKYCSKSCNSKARIGEKAANWKDKPGYGGIHVWIRLTSGKASFCQNPNCKRISNDFDWANLSGHYFREQADWIQLCASCHQYMDRKNVCPRGHDFTVENTYWHPKRNRRHCRSCMKITAARRKGVRVAS